MKTIDAAITAKKSTPHRKSRYRAKIMGIGGCGCDMIHRLMEDEKQAITMIACDTDEACLEQIHAHHRILLGSRLLHGAGAQGQPDLGQRGVWESRDELVQSLQGTDMLFLLAGMGGGTGTSAISAVARLAKEAGALTIAVVTAPFPFEGLERGNTAEHGITLLTRSADATIVIPYEQFLSTINHDPNPRNIFNVANPVLGDLMKLVTIGLVETLLNPIICLDLNDATQLLGNIGRAYVGWGIGSGQRGALEAAHNALADPLLNGTLTKVERLMIIMQLGLAIPYEEISEVTKAVCDATNPEASILLGAALDGQTRDLVQVALIAGGGL